MQVAQTVSADATENMIVDYEPTPDIVAEEREEAAITRGALALLPPNEQKVIHRYFFNEEHLSTIARDLGITRQRAGQIKDRALQRLAKLLPNQKGDADE